MLVYRINPDGTPGVAIEVSENTSILTADLTFSKPPRAAEGQFVVFDHAVRAWSLTDIEPELGAPLVEPSRIITVLAFRQRFTMAEKAAIEMASLDNPLASADDRQQAAALRAYLGDLAVATFVDLARADTIAGVQQLEAFGVLAAGRAEDILSSPVSWSELPQDQQRAQGV